MSGASSTDTHQHFLHALRRVLRPIIKLLIRSGIRYDEFADVARGAYVESAVRDGIGELKHPTREQVAWATGIVLERVNHYIEGGVSLPTIDRTAAATMAEVLHRWHTNRRYLDTYGTPVELEINASPRRSFHDLVTEVDAGIDPGFVLAGLLQAKSVIYSGDKRIRPVTRYYISPQDGTSSFEYFGATLARMIETHEHNFNSTDAENKRLERSVFADRGLPSPLIPSFHSLVMERADQFLVELDDWFGQIAEDEANRAEPRVEIGINVFFYVESPPDLESLKTLTQPRRGTVETEKGSGS